MSEGSKFYINKERMRPDEKEQEAIKESRQALDMAIERDVQATRERMIPFSPEMISFIADAKTWHEERFRRLGVEQVTWGEHIFKVRELKGRRGESGLGITRIKDLSAEELTPVPIEEAIIRKEYLPLEVPNEFLAGAPKKEATKNLRDYLEALHIIHELYHDASQTSLFAKTEINATSGEKYHLFDKSESPFDRFGMGYIRHMKPGESPAVEEGMAMTVQKESERFTAQHFSEGSRLYELLLNYVKTKDPSLGKVPRDILTITNFDGESVSYDLMPYVNGHALVAYLSRRIPNLFELVEQARINGKVMPLARAVDKKFGRTIGDKKTFTKIFAATEEEAGDIPLDLQRKLNSGSSSKVMMG